MRIPKPLLAGLLALPLMAMACSDDETPVTAGDQDGADRGDVVVSIPERAPDLAGTITSVEPFVPVTEECTPPEDLDPDAAVSSDDPPICTPDDNEIVGTILVEESPGEPNDGRKVSYTVTTTTAIAGEGADGVGVGTFEGFAEGQTVDTWVPADGACAESYPEQCGLEAVRVTG